MTPSHSFSVLLFVCCIINGLNGVSSSDVPFPSNLVGKNYTRYVSGLRFPVQEQVIVSATEIIFFPEFAPPAGPFAFRCVEKLSFSINRQSGMVTTTKFPKIVIQVGDSDMNPNVNTSGTCESEQEKIKIVYKPTGPTAPMFRNQTKQIAAGLNRVRDGDAPRQGIPAELQEGNPPCGQNFQLEAVTGYIRTVAFENGFCAE